MVDGWAAPERSTCAGGGDEGLEQSLLGRIDGGRLLRMPLHGDQEGVIPRLDRLDGAVRRARNDGETRRDAPDRLVMGRRRAGLALGEDRGEPRARLDRDRVQGRRPRSLSAVRDGLPERASLPHHVGQVLDQGPAESHVENLAAAADAERRQAPLEGGLRQGDLELVAGAVDPVERRVLRASIELRIDIAAARENEGVQAPEELAPARLARRDQPGNPPARRTAAT